MNVQQLKTMMELKPLQLGVYIFCSTIHWTSPMIYFNNY